MGKLLNRSWVTYFIVIAMIAFLTACGTDELEDKEMKNTEKADSGEEMEKNEEKNGEDTAKKDDSSSDEKKEKDDMSQKEMNGEEVSGEVASPLLKEGETVTYSFPDEGEYKIHCDPHPVMKMTVIVKQDAPSTKHVELDIADYEYSEKELVVAPGTSITWTNRDLAEHNVHIVVK
ncbi:plastocyanin/azurin family copper-binding protein [Virgibacillus necropolis]|uniref:Blue (type 1) copper domain-containing protein n=1 Tax=Virgibacillus necropolis TaxID=163877 RepID=A0A221MGD4_9BACI|nr:plastocyanin/azurin family copper-binding protein [Virgibacillus necropolis]ASN06718.1 hypothetical protein CFK40_17700 [Virgibacillus necropolis]